MPRKPTTPAGPLIAAVYAMLPSPSVGYSVDQQDEWLTMMRQALCVTYGGEQSQSTVAPSTPAAKPAPPLAPVFPFMVNPQGYAISAKGKRIMPAEVNGAVLYDMRGEADIGAIIWADDSTGVIGFAGEISAVMQ